MLLKQEITFLNGRDAMGQPMPGAYGNFVLTWARAPWGWTLIGMVEYAPTPSIEG